VQRTTVSPCVTRTEPAACFAIRPVSRVKVEPPSSTDSVTILGNNVTLISLCVGARVLRAPRGVFGGEPGLPVRRRLKRCSHGGAHRGRNALHAPPSAT